MGQKRVKGIPVDYSEHKLPHRINLTDTAWSAIALQAKASGISKSEAIERWARSLPKPQNTENVTHGGGKQSVSSSDLRRGLSTEKPPQI